MEFDGAGPCDAEVDLDGICDDIDLCVNLTNVAYDDGSCEYEVLGCTDEMACNYDMDANTDDGSCLMLDECGVCGGDGIPAGDCDCDGNQEDVVCAVATVCLTPTWTASATM